MLEAGYHYWFTGDRAAAIAYFDTGAWWVAAGAPICDDQRLASVTQAFLQAGQAEGRRVSFFGSTRRLVQALAHWDHLLVGLEACWNPSTWSTDAAVRSQVRSQTRRSARKGVVIRTADPGELDDQTVGRAEAERLMHQWLRGRNMAPLGFLARLDPFTLSRERRYFLAHQQGRLVGLLAAVPVYTRKGWFLEHLVVEPRAPHGTSEALIDAAMVALEMDGATFASMGMVALAGVGESAEDADGHPVLRFLLRNCYHSLNWLYGFQGLRSFRSKFKPRMWEPVYLLAPDRIGPTTLLAVLDAFAGGHMGRFVAITGHRILNRGLSRVPGWMWPRAAQALSALLLPWIGVLLWVDGQRWFGCDWLGQAWAGFDLLVAGLFAILAWGLQHKADFTRILTRLLLGMVLTDAWLTTSQAVLYHGGGPYNWFEEMGRWAAVGAPWFAVVFIFLLQVAN